MNYLKIFVLILSIFPLISTQDDPKDSLLEKLTFGTQEATVRYESKNVANLLNSMPINCFQFSTATPKKDYPGKSSLSTINEKTLKRNMKEENAIQIIFKNGKPDINQNDIIDKSIKYYVIGVMWYPGEYHFVRSFKDGWFSKPSKVGRGNFVTDKFKSPSEGLSNLLAKQSGPRTYNFLGFYLYPINEDNVKKLIGNSRLLIEDTDNNTLKFLD